MFLAKKLGRQASVVSAAAAASSLDPSVSGALLGIALELSIPFTKVGASAQGKIFTEYIIKCKLLPAPGSPANTPTVQWETARRYSEFLELDRQLRGKLKGGLAALPPKRLLSKFEDAVIAERKSGLCEFLKSALALAEPHAELSTILAKFLELPGSKPQRSASAQELAAGPQQQQQQQQHGRGEDSTAVKTDTPDGEAVHGYLYKRGGPAQVKPFRQCFFVLGQDGTLRWYRTSQPQLLGTFPLATQSEFRATKLDPGVMGVPPGAFGFSIWSPERELILYADTSDDRELWVSFCLTKLPDKSKPSAAGGRAQVSTPPKPPLPSNPAANNHKDAAAKAPPAGDVARKADAPRKSKVETPVQQAERELDKVRRIPEDWAIEWTELKIQEKVGGGAFGTVFRGRLWGSVVAVKQLNNSDGVTPQLRLALEKEISVLSKLRHPNIVLYIGASFIQGNGAIVTEWCGRGSLFQVLKEPKQRISAAEMLGIALQTARGMGYLHSRMCIHRDLKSLNVLITDGFEAKVADFGLTVMREAAASRVRAESRQSGVSSAAGGGDFFGTEGTAQWMAPEVMEGSRYNHKVDVYSFGILLTELLTRHMPFADNFAGFEFVDAVIDRAERPTVPRWAQSRDDYFDDDALQAELPPAAADEGPGPGNLGALVDLCTRRDPAARPDFDFIVQRLERLSERNSPLSLLRDFDLPRLVESLDMGDLVDVEAAAFELAELAHRAAHPGPAALLLAAEPSLGASRRGSQSQPKQPSPLEAFAPDIARAACSRLSWGKAQRVVERGGDSEVVELSEAVVRQLALGLAYTCAATSGSAALAAAAMAKAKGVADVVQTLLRLVVEARMDQCGSLLSLLRQADADFAAIVDRGVAALLETWGKAAGGGTELATWRLAVFGLLPAKHRAKLMGHNAADVSALEANVRALEQELMERRSELWLVVQARVAKDVDKV